MTRAFLCSVGMLLVVDGANTAPAPETARTFLTAVFKTTSEELERVDAGQVVSRSLGVSEPREVATMGVVRIRATPEFYAERLADIVNFKRDEAVLQIGLFGDPPAPHDIADLTLDSWDIGKIRECRVGDCGVQLPADAIDRFRTDVDWTGADPEQQ